MWLCGSGSGIAGGMDEASARATAAAQTLVRETRQKGRDLGFILNRMATALEQSARLADQHAERQARGGRPEAAAEERRAARRAREASQLARARAVRLLMLGGDQGS